MPPFTKKTKDVLSWDAFPEESPEAKDWKPNPDDVAKPLELKDPRLNRDPQEAQRKAAAKHDARLGITPAPTWPSSVADLTTGHGHPGWKTWSPKTLQTNATAITASVNAQAAPNSYGEPVQPPHRAAATATATASPSPSPSPSQTVSMSASKVSRTQAIFSINGTTENFPVSPAVQAPSISSSRSSIPAWAGPLEKLLAEGMASERSSMMSHQTSPRQLRESQSPNGEVKRLKPPTDLDAHFMAASEASRRASQSASSTVTVVDKEAVPDQLAKKATTKSLHAVAEQVPKSQEKTPAAKMGSEKLSADYQRFLDVVLIKFMEGELDLGTHGTKAQLLAMDNARFDVYFEKIKMTYKQLWISEKLRSRDDRVHGA